MFGEIFKDGNPKDKQDNTPLHEAAGIGQLDLCKFIVECIKKSTRKGFSLQCDANGKSPFHTAAESGHFEVCKFLIDNAVEKNPVFKQGVTLLHDMASIPKNKKVIGVTPLHHGVEKQYYDATRYLIGILEDKNPADDHGTTPLHRAAQSGHSEIVKCIIQCIKDKNPRDSRGITPLHYAAQSDYLDIYKMISQDLALKNPPSDTGHTPLHSALKN